MVLVSAYSSAPPYGSVQSQFVLCQSQFVLCNKTDDFCVQDGSLIYNIKAAAIATCSTVDFR